MLGNVVLGFVWISATWASLSLRSDIPPWPIFASNNDDEMQVRLADAIADGRWLGDWSQTTLSKGPGYPVFLTIAHDLGLNPMMAAQVLYLAGATLVAAGLLGLVRSRWLAGLVYSAVAMNPAMFGAPASRVYRESLTAALAIMCLGLVLVAAWIVVARWRWYWKAVALAPVALALGVVTGWLTQTRIDTIWIAPAVAVVVAGSVFWGTRTWAQRGRHALVWAGVGALALSTVTLVGNRVADLNQQHYGVSVTDDFSSGAFAEMSNAWAGVQAGGPRTYVPISAAQRAAVYAVSPDAALMKRYLDGKKEFFGRSASCQAAGVCDDYAGGWMPWAMREAARKQTPTAAALQEYFGRVRDDINAACSDGRLSCGAQGLGPGVPALADIDRALIRANLQKVLESGYQGFASAGMAATYLSTDDPESLALWQRNVWGVPDLLNTAPEWVSPDTAAQVARLQSSFTRAANLLLAPALIGLLWALLRRGYPRRAALVGVGVLGACAAHATILSVYSAGSGAPTGHDFYLIASTSFFITGLVLGAWALVDGCLWLLRRAVPARDRTTIDHGIPTGRFADPSGGNPRPGVTA